MTMDNGAERREQLRDRAVRAAEVAPGLPESISCALVGMSFVAEYPRNVRHLERLLSERYWANPDAPEPVACLLRRNPDNEYDANACEIHFTDDDVPAAPMLGHLPRGVAARLAPEMDGGAKWSAVVTGVRTHPANPENPGVDVRLTRLPDITGSTVEDLIRESVGELQWGELDFELRTRFPAEWEAPGDDPTRRELLTEILIAECKKGRNGQ